MHRVEPLQQPSLTAPSPSPATPSGPHTEEHHQAPSRILPFSQFLKIDKRIKLLIYGAATRHCGCLLHNSQLGYSR
uniref:Uncharacterized protein n=1 Tax=Arundo donax TaxID=35708 RepID=A0A0A9HPC2_ARUDO